MKRVSIFGGVALLVIISVAMVRLPVRKTPQAAPGGFAVVELFTSEGCSSCPPADEAVAKLLDEYSENVFVLGFHVDYWNRLGWQDVYSSSAFTTRQQQYSNALHLTIYTPQAIVNGITEFTGSDNNRLHAAVEEGLQTAKGAMIQLSATRGNNDSVNVSYQLPASTGSILNIALVQLHAHSDVKRGENSGRQLQHVNVVRAFTSITVKEKNGRFTLALLQGLDAGGCRVIAYLQDPISWKITGAAAADVALNRMLATILHSRCYFRAYLDIFAAICSGV